MTRSRIYLGNKSENELREELINCYMHYSNELRVDEDGDEYFLVEFYVERIHFLETYIGVLQEKEYKPTCVIA